MDPRPLALLPLLAAALAGCVSPTAPGGGTPPAASGWALDCSLGAVEAALDPAWPQECMARASHTPGEKAETWLAVNPTDPQNVVIAAKEVNSDASADCVWNAVQVTKDGGRTWTDVTIGGRYADRRPGEPWFGYACNTDPMFAFGPTGDLHYAVEVYHFLMPSYNTPNRQVAGSAGILGWKVLLATSHDGGLTWPDVVTYQPDLVTVTDYSRMAVSPTTGSILTAINRLGPNGCDVLASRDGGRTADLPVLLEGGCRTISVSPAGVVVVGDGGGQARFARSADDGRTFGPVQEGFTYRPIPSPFQESGYRTGVGFETVYDLTDGPRRGTLYAITAEAVEGDEADIVLRSSPDDGVTWEGPWRVNGDAAGPHQFNPNLAVAGDGSLHAFWMDKRHDPRHVLIDVVHGTSLDGGRTWAEERVTSRSFDGELGRHQSGAPFIGDYIGVAAVGGHVWAGVPDGSLGGPTVVAAAHVHRLG